MRIALTIILVVWALLFFGAFIAFYLLPDLALAGGARFNSAFAFLGLQSAATLVAVLCLVLRWSSDDPRLRFWASIPAVCAGVLGLGFAALYLWASALSN